MAFDRPRKLATGSTLTDEALALNRLTQARRSPPRGLPESLYPPCFALQPTVPDVHLNVALKAVIGGTSITKLPVTLPSPPREPERDPVPPSDVPPLKENFPSGWTEIGPAIAQGPANACAGGSQADW